MTIPLAAPQIAERVLLRGIRWRTYEAILDDLDNRNLRLTYDDGYLEILATTSRQQILGGLIARFIHTLTLELAIPIHGVKSTTWKDERKAKGIEADESYYVQNERLVRGQMDCDPTHPPPDLAVEVEITPSTLDRLAVYAALGIPELWRSDGQRVSAWVLGPEGSYRESERSLALPFLRVRDLERFLARRTETGETSLMIELQAWVRGLARAPGGPDNPPPALEETR